MVYRAAVMVLLLGAGLGTGALLIVHLVPDAKDECPEHGHASFLVVAGGERRRWFDEPVPALGPPSSRLELPDDHTVHLEAGCVTVGAFVQDALGGRLTRDGLTLPGPGGSPVLHVARGGETASFHVQSATGAWLKPTDMPAHVLKDGERLLLYVGPDSGEAIDAWRKRVPAPLGPEPFHARLRSTVQASPVQPVKVEQAVLVWPETTNVSALVHAVAGLGPVLVKVQILAPEGRVVATDELTFLPGGAPQRLDARWSGAPGVGRVVAEVRGLGASGAAVTMVVHAGIGD